MAYKYKMTSSDGQGYVEFNTNPDFETTILIPGDKVSIIGQVCWNNARLDDFRVRIDSPMPHTTKTDVIAEKGRVTPFSVTLDIGTELFESTERICLLSLSFLFSRIGGGGTYTYGDQAISTTLLRYRLAPRILAMDFERATPEGAWADDGQYLQCKSLKLATDPQAVADDFTKATIVCAGSDGSTRSVNLTKEQIAAALTSGGYSETKPGIFSDFVSALGVDYTLTLTLGDDYDQATFADTVMRSFARLHLSGAKNGGVAVGMFSSATDQKPKFEVADTHEAHFYGGIYGVPEYLGKVFLYYVSYPSGTANGSAVSTTVTITPPEGANFFLYQQRSTSYNATLADVTIGPLTNGERTCTIRIFRNAASAHTSGVSLDIHCFKILGYVEPVTEESNLPEVEGPGIFDEPYVDPGVARADYIAMMAGIEIPEDAETAATPGAQANPNDMESPGIESEPAPSAHYETVERYYRYDCWSAAMVRMAVGRWITGEEANRILATKKESE